MADVTVNLSSDEALILFELLHRWEDADWYENAELLPGERTVLWALSALLERQLVEPFEPGYPDLVGQARERLREIGNS